MFRTNARREGEVICVDICYCRTVAIQKRLPPPSQRPHQATHLAVVSKSVRNRPNPLDRGRIGVVIALRISGRARGLTEHVEGMAVALLLIVASALKGLSYEEQVQALSPQPVQNLTCRPISISRIAASGIS